MAGRGSGGASGSAPKKKSIFRGIEPFKHKVEIDPDYAAKTWKKLEDAIHEIHNLNNAYGLSFEELFRCVRSIKPCSFAARRVGLASFRFRARLIGPPRVGCPSRSGKHAAHAGYHRRSVHGLLPRWYRARRRRELTKRKSKP
jgi:hypothetical protein